MSLQLAEIKAKVVVYLCNQCLKKQVDFAKDICPTCEEKVKNLAAMRRQFRIGLAVFIALIFIVAVVGVAVGVALSGTTRAFERRTARMTGRPRQLCRA